MRDHRQPPALTSVRGSDAGEFLECLDGRGVLVGGLPGEGSHVNLGAPPAPGCHHRRPLHVVGQNAHVQLLEVLDGGDIGVDIGVVEK